jgi:putative endonuclease
MQQQGSKEMAKNPVEYDPPWMAAPGKLERLWIDLQERGLRRLERIPNWRGHRQAPHLVTGLRGERAAMFELRRRGYIVVARRWTSARMRGDVDLIAWDGGELCFVEVKTRTVRGLTPAEWAVDEDKRRMLRRLAKVYLKGFPERERKTIPARFDVVSVYSLDRNPEFDLFPAAFSWR